MTFGPEHYVPILKLKLGEKSAHRALRAPIRSRVSPLFEIVEMDGKKSLSKHLDTAFKGLEKCVTGFARYFLDAREIAASGPTGAEQAFERASKLGTTFVPVTSISRSEDVQAVTNNRKNGIAIRLRRDEFERAIIPSALPAWLRKSGISPAEVDLIVDLGPVDDMIAEGVSALATAFLADVPTLDSWRSLTLSACAFPRSIGGVERNSYTFVERSEWRAWRDGIYSNRRDVGRLPTFSDCAIQHPSGVEGFDPKVMSVSASIRYALENHWLLIKGESTDVIPETTQFPAWARRLVYGHLSPNFAKASHCFGCEGMESCANDEPNLGSAGAWRRLGTIHRITRTIDGLERLAWT